MLYSSNEEIVVLSNGIPKPKNKLIVKKSLKNVRIKNILYDT